MQACRPREKLQLHGPRSMSDAELLSILLRTGSQGENSLGLSQRLLQQFGCISSILSSSFEELKEFKGIGVSKWSQLKVIEELVQRSYLEKIKQDNVLTSTEAVKNYLIGLIGKKEYEVFVCLYLDIHLRVIDIHEIFRGSISETTVHIREIAKECLLRNASHLIIAHNHPSGNLKPSKEDLELTQSLLQALELIDVHLLDHCIVSKNGGISFLDLNLMP
jgi:DNA repair protein RadC